LIFLGCSFNINVESILPEYKQYAILRTDSDIVYNILIHADNVIVNEKVEHYVFRMKEGKTKSVITKVY